MAPLRFSEISAPRRYSAPTVIGLAHLALGAYTIFSAAFGLIFLAEHRRPGEIEAMLTILALGIGVAVGGLWIGDRRPAGAWLAVACHVLTLLTGLGGWLTLVLLGACGWLLMSLRLRGDAGMERASRM